MSEPEGSSPVLARPLIHRTALVTGASRGIGRAIAVLLHAQGARVALAARSQGPLEALRAELGPADSAVICMDLRDSAAGSRAVAAAEAALGPLHILIHAAAPMFPLQRIMQVDDDAVREQLGTSVGALAGLCRAAVGSMLGHRWGRIIALTSVAASAGAGGSALYGAGKAGMEGLIRSLAVDHGRHGITANAVSVAFCDSERFRERTDAAQRARAERATALGRIPRPEEVAAVVGFLCSPQAGIITGSVVEATAGSQLNTLW